MALWNAPKQYATKYPLIGLPVIFLVGALSWGAFNWSLELTNTESFCISCHAMRDFVYAEYQKTKHFQNRTGVRASCPDCHVPKEWVHKVVRKVKASNELYHWLIGSLDSRKKFEAKRGALAKQVWAGMAATDSRECRNCHGIDFMLSKAQTAQAGVMHSLAEKWGETCISCHKGIAHSLPEGFDEDALMSRLHTRMENEKVACRSCHTEMAAPPKGQGW